MSTAMPRSAGRPRNPDLDAAIMAAAERQLGELGYARMSLESVAAAAGTTVPAVRRRYRGKAALAAAVIGSLRAADLPVTAASPREHALAILQNFQVNLEREDAMALVGTLLVEECRYPELLAIFRENLAGPRRALLRQALSDGAAAGQLAVPADLDALTNMLIGSFYARYLSTSDIPADWAERSLRLIWPPNGGLR
jgi:AcrR family transcriptional regulator